MKLVKKKVIIEAIIEVNEDFDTADLSIGKYEFDNLTDTDYILPKVDTEEEFFRLADYLKITEQEAKNYDEEKSND